MAGQLDIRLSQVGFCAVILSIFMLATVGCALVKGFEVDTELLKNKSIFKTSQEPSFSMTLAEGTEYKGEKDKRAAKVDLGYVDKTHLFANEAEQYLLMVNMTTVSLAEWGADTPWRKDMGKEPHGNKDFDCGIGFFDTKTEAGLAKRFTYKAWMYVPGGIGSPGTTRVVVYYIEPGDYQEDLGAFISRADSRADFKM